MGQSRPHQIVTLSGSPVPHIAPRRHLRHRLNMRTAITLIAFSLAATPAVAEDPSAARVYLDCIAAKAPVYAPLDATIPDVADVVLAACDGERFALEQELDGETETSDRVYVRALEKARADALVAVASARLKAIR